MAQTNVASCVLSIVASFSSGIDVFKRFRKTGKRRKSRTTSRKERDSEELHLARSLRQGPEDIGREYQKAISHCGDQFAVGDVIAQTSLAEVLLKLNTGLVTIINTFLAHEKKDVQIDYQSLTSLSDRSRSDTCRTLRALYRRLIPMNVPNPVAAPNARRSEVSKAQDDERRKGKPAASKHTKVRGPMLARVVIANSSESSQIALVRPGERGRKSASTLSGSTKVASAASTVNALPLSSPPVAKSTVQPARPANHRAQTSPSSYHIDNSVPKGRSRTDALQATRSTSHLEDPARRSHEPLPPLPKPPPLPPMEPRRRKPTPTYYSIATQSANGEIPLHRWAEPYDFDAMSMLNRQAMTSGWPLTECEHVEAKKKRGGLFKLFRKNKD